MDILESEHQLKNAVEAALGVLAAPGSTATAGMNQRSDGAGGGAATDARPEVLQDEESGMQILT
eukprot:7643295-Lingulodinium_polyedra.AAC.1